MKIWEIFNEKNIGKSYVDEDKNIWVLKKYTFLDLVDKTTEKSIEEIHNIDYLFKKNFEELEDIDWNRVSVDTKILVKNNMKGKWTRRYFSKFENGKVYAWQYGATSYSAGKEDVTSWNYAILNKYIDE